MKKRYILVACLASALRAQAQDLPKSGFGPQQLITNTTNGARMVHAADLDQDGDMDMLSASSDDNKIAWYANEGGGNFGPQQLITSELHTAWAVYAADLDNDGDIDVLAAALQEKIVAWYENNGDGSFGEQQVITTDLC